jgi:hypothetical protein
MKIAIIGSGVSGLAATWVSWTAISCEHNWAAHNQALNECNHEHEVHLYEADARPGGHANTVSFTRPSEGKASSVDVDTCVHYKMHWLLEWFLISCNCQWFRECRQCKHGRMCLSRILLSKDRSQSANISQFLEISQTEGRACCSHWDDFLRITQRWCIRMGRQEFVYNILSDW